MICGLLHPGSGLGNMLFRYITTRILALDKGFEFSMINPEGFKGKSFMNLDFGVKNNIPYHVEMPSGKIIQDDGWNKLPLWEEKTSYYNPEINYVEDNTIIDGNFEDGRYFEHRMSEVGEWLKITHQYIPENLCIIGFRGGEYKTIPELWLPKSYWDEARHLMIQKYPGIRFEVHTDDPKTAREFFPIYPIIHDVEQNWRAVRYARYSIIANSSFYVLPRLLKHHQDNAFTIAPKYWNRYNTKEWKFPQNYYRQFTQI